MLHEWKCPFVGKGQIILNDFLKPSISSKNRTKTSITVVKSNSFVRFLEEIEDIKKHFEIN